MGKQGKKNCPKCNKELGVRTIKCSCGHEFIAKNKEKKEKTIEKENKKNSMAEEKKEKSYTVYQGLPLAYAGESSPKMNGIEHAERILSYGEKKARILLQQHKLNCPWPHVDWKYLENKLNIES